jgi:hypothetical protein
MAYTYDLRKALYKTIEDIYTTPATSKVRVLQFDNTQSFAAEVFLDIVITENSVDNVFSFSIEFSNSGEYSVRNVSLGGNSTIKFFISEGGLYVLAQNINFERITSRKSVLFGVITSASIENWVSSLPSESDFIQLFQTALSSEDFAFGQNVAVLGNLSISGKLGGELTYDRVSIEGAFTSGFKPISATKINNEGEPIDPFLTLNSQGNLYVKGLIYSGFEEYPEGYVGSAPTPVPFLRSIASDGASSEDAFTSAVNTDGQIVFTTNRFVTAGKSELESAPAQTIYGNKNFIGNNSYTGSSSFTGVTTVSGNLTVDNIKIDGTEISTTQNEITINPNSGGSSNTGTVIIAGNLTVNGETTTVNSTIISVDDKNIELGSVATPNDSTANGGGITLRGATDKTILWDSTNSNWTSSEHWNLLNNKVFKINNVSVLSSDTLGGGIVNSSLTKVGALSSGTAGPVLVSSTGALSSTAILSPANGGTGVNNGERTLTVNTNSGTISFSAASTTLTVANNASISGSSSGTNTGDQTISLTGVVSGNGSTGQITTTIANGNITNAMLANSAISGVSLGQNLGALSNSIGGGISTLSYNGSATTSISVDSTVVRTSVNQTIDDEKTFSGITRVTNTTPNSGSLTAGAFRVTGGASFGQNVFIQGDLYFSSDERLKSKHETISGSYLESVLGTDVWKFSFKDRPESIEIGVMAQEIEKNFPYLAGQLVTTNKTDKFEDEKSVKELKFIYVLWAALQEESAKRKELELEVREIKAMLEGR